MIVNRRTVMIASGVIAAGVLAVVLEWESDDVPAPAPQSLPSTEIEDRDAADVRPSGQMRLNPSPTMEPALTRSLAERFKRETDYLALATSIIVDAQAGNADAQYYLSEILRYCTVEYRTYFKTRGPDRSLEDAQAHANSTYGLSAKIAGEVYHRCFDLVARTAPNRFGTRDEWVARAAENGQPLAQLARARDVLVESRFGSTKDVPDPQPAPRSQMKEEAIRLLGEALRASKDAEVLWKASDLLQAYAGEGTDMTDETWAWRLAACQRGYDCSESAEWIGFMCRHGTNCESATGLDLIKTATGDHFNAVADTAAQINRIIDQEDWDQLTARATNSSR